MTSGQAQPRGLLITANQGQRTWRSGSITHDRVLRPYPPTSRKSSTIQNTSFWHPPFLADHTCSQHIGREARCQQASQCVIQDRTCGNKGTYTGRGSPAPYAQSQEPYPGLSPGRYLPPKGERIPITMLFWIKGGLEGKSFLQKRNLVLLASKNLKLWKSRSVEKQS